MLKTLLEKNAQHKISVLGPHLQGSQSVLDVGCGDLRLSESLYTHNTKLKITGVDVVDFGRRPKNIAFVKYDGTRLPFKDKSFDSVVVYHVLHHCPDSIAVLKECIRVSKKQLLIVEPVFRNKMEIPFMWYMDWIFNIWKSEPISLPYIFRSKKEWYSLFKKENIKIKNEIDIDKFPQWIPIGRGYLFSLQPR